MPNELEAKVLSAKKDSQMRASLLVEVQNVGDRPRVMTNIYLTGCLRYVVDDAFVWIEPGELREIASRLRLLSDELPTDRQITARAWNYAPGCETTATVH